MFKETTLKDHQQAMIQLLCEMERICKKYEIRYMLFAGTLLGAVRHQGYIPWDDDLDVIMLRPEYEKFLIVAKKEINVKKFYLQEEYSEHWPMFFSKLRLQNTAAIEKFHPKDKMMHQGIYIDIFPCDNLSDRMIVRRLQFVASKVVIAKGLYQRGYETDSKMKKLFLQLCRLLPLKPFLVITQLRWHNDTEKVHCFVGGASRYIKSIFPRKWMMEIMFMKFEDGYYPISEYYDGLLTQLYGDYMTLPEDVQRICKVHAVIVDVYNSYQIYLEQQSSMKITDFTRSIR